MSKTSKSRDAVDHPPVYTAEENVKIYHLHTPFQPPPTTRHNTFYQNHSPAPVQKHTPENQDKKKFVSEEMELGRYPGVTTCFFCRHQVMTNVTYKAGVFAWVMCFVFIFCGLLIGCCLIPFFVKDFKDAYHTCPRCYQVLYVKKKSCC